MQDPSNTDKSKRRVLTKHGPLKEETATHSRVLVWITPWIVWKGKKIRHWKMSPTGWKVFNIPLGSSVQFSSVTQSCPTLCNPMNCSTPGLPVHDQLPESTQTHIHQVGDAIQPSHPLLSPSPSAPNPSQHQSLFQWVNSLHEVAYWSFSFSIILSKDPRADLLQNGLVGSPCSPRDSQESSPTPQFKSINSSALSLLHIINSTKFMALWEDVMN